MYAFTVDSFFSDFLLKIANITAVHPIAVKDAIAMTPEPRDSILVVRMTSGNRDNKAHEKEVNIQAVFK